MSLKENYMRNELYLYATYYQSMGMNISPIEKTNYKKPVIENWKRYISIKQDEIHNFNWEDSVGIGLISGFNEYRALDIDELYYSYYDRRGRIDDFVAKCLAILGLPQDYAWVIDSGSGRGLHIIFRMNDFEYSEEVYSYSAKRREDRELFKRMELRWKAFLVLPPSQHKEGGKYQFRNNAIPAYKPYYVNNDHVYNLLNYFCGDYHFEECNYNGMDFNLVRITKQVATSSHENCYDEVEDNLAFIKDCKSKDAFNTMGTFYATGKMVELDMNKAINYFNLSNNDMAHFNIASLISIGVISGSEADMMFHLTFCSDFPIDKLDLVKANYHIRTGKHSEQSKKENETQILFFDTEATGLPDDYDEPTTNTANWPRLVQLSWVVTNEKGEKLKEHDFVIYPDGYTISKSAIDLHGITLEKAYEKGQPLKDVLSLFMKDFQQAKYVVGHNVAFDKKIIGAELVRMGQEDVMEQKQSFCTMLLSTNYCRIPGYYGHKYPKLQELHNKLFGIGFDDAHNSMADVNATVKCFWEMNRIGLIPMQEIQDEQEHKTLTLDSNFNSQQLNTQKPQSAPIEEKEEEINERNNSENERIILINERIISENERIILEEEKEQEPIEEEQPVITEKQKFSIKGVDFNMVFVKGGTFLMGNETEKTVEDYYICETAVTQALWIAVMGNNPSWYEGDDFPVENISWNDASEFVKRLSDMTGKTFRLPSEAEWEFAARGGIYSKGYQYSGSDDIENVAWYKENSQRKTHSVKTKLPNELGLYDMSGNVYEWCEDWRDENYKILRGGCWGSTVKGCMTTYRFDSSPDTKGGDGGVRIAMDI